MRSVIVLLVVLLAAPSIAQADDASRLGLAREVVEVAHSADNMRAVMPIMQTQMRQLLVQQGNADAAQIDIYIDRFQKRFNDEIPQFVNLVAEVYAREFTEDDLTNLLAFYRTPTGQHFLGKAQELSKGFLLAGQQWGKNVAQEVMAEMQKEKAAASPPKL